MRFTTGRARLLLSVMAAVAILAAGCSSASEQETTQASVVIPGAKSLKNVAAEAWVEITLDAQTKKCVVSYKDDPFYVAPGQLVKWFVVNNCDEQTVKNIEVRFTGTDPLIHGPKLKIPVLAFGDNKPIHARGKAKELLTNGAKYPYQFYIDDVAQGDPDIIIEFDTMIIVPPLITGPRKNK